MAWGRKYPDGEQKGGNVCIIAGCSKRKSRSGMGTCGSRKCLATAQRILLSDEGIDPHKDGRDPGKGLKVKVDGKGSTKSVKSSKTVRGTHCYVLDDGTTVPMDRCKPA